MKKVLQILSASLVGIGLMTTVASAASVTCGNISNTGPGSTNTITCVDTTNTTLDCVNNVVVVNASGQNAVSGNGFVVQNTSGGDVTTGNAANSNATVVTIGAGCAPVQTAVTTPTPPAGGQGGGEVAAAATPAPAAKKPVALPKTGSNSVVNEAVTGLAIVAGALAVSQLGVQAYRRFALK